MNCFLHAYTLLIYGVHALEKGWTTIRACTVVRSDVLNSCFASLALKLYLRFLMNVVIYEDLLEHFQFHKHSNDAGITSQGIFNTYAISDT